MPWLIASAILFGVWLRLWGEGALIEGFRDSPLRRIGPP